MKSTSCIIELRHSLNSNEGSQKYGEQKKALDDAVKNGFTGVVVSSEYNANSGLWNITLQRDGGTKRLNYQVSKDLIKAIDPDAQAVSGNAAVTSTSKYNYKYRRYISYNHCKACRIKSKW